MKNRPIRTLRQIALRALGFGSVAAISGLLAAAPVHAGGTTSSSSDESGKQTEDYWTPERMKDAKPIPMPHPDASKTTPVPPPQKDGEATDDGVSGPGEKP